MPPTGVLDTAKATNPLKDLLKFGQSVWLDYIRRDLITSGELKRLIEQDGLRGMTSNPAIFEKAIAGSTDYADILASLKSREDLDAKARYEVIAIRDIQDATDLMRPVYEQSQKRDGYVSLEVSPYLARETQATLEEARRLWKAVDRANLMIKVPGTAEGIPAFEQLIGEGINVNVTLLFAQDVYQQVAEAYIRGLHRFAASGGDVSRMASVASFFISRIDNAVDSEVSTRLKSAKNPAEEQQLKSLLGKVAIANGKLAYQRYLNIFSGPEWDALRAKGAQTQRVLWASTSTKNPAYPDILYVQDMIGPDTVNTIPPATFDAFRDHGQPRETLTEDVEGAKQTMETLAALGISIDKITDKLTEDGVRLFEEAFDKLLAAVEKSTQGASPLIRQQRYTVPDPLGKQIAEAANDWRAGGKVRRLWQRDATLWTGTDEAQWLGWLDIAEKQHEKKDQFERLREEIRQDNFRDILLLGMGGSSLCPEVLEKTFGHIQGFPRLHVLDSTDPAQIKTFEKKIDLAKTLFIVSSKSGSTLEPNIFKQYFFQRVKQTVGADQAASRFLAITDPGSKLEKEAEADKFRYIFHGVPSIGGRYSALSNFGMIPAAAMGLDVAKFLDRAEQMVEACAPAVAVENNPGVMLGIVLGQAAKAGRDKVTIVASPAISDLGAWLEQLLAESTGKQGRGIIPVDRENLNGAEVYGKDRVFAYLRFTPAPDPVQDEKIAALEKAGQPVIRIAVEDLYDIGQEFFRWEIATAVAGSILGINAFNQPDVEASKVETRKLTSEYEKNGSLPSETPLFSGNGIQLFADAKNASALGKADSLAGYLRAHLGRINPGDYFAILAYIEMNDAHEAALESIRQLVRDRKHVATCLGFGPRFLHSTGQAYKGGPNSGVFLQITSGDPADVPVPGQKYSFGVVKAAQARGDLQVLGERGRRAVRVDIGKDVDAGLAQLSKAIGEILS